MKTTARLLLALCVVMGVALPSFAAKKRATVKITNQSKWDIHHIYFSSTSDRQWGEDYLGDDILERGDSLTITDITCDDYDIRVVDEDGDECIIEEVELCGDEAYWKITDKDLLSCEGYR